MRSVAYCVILVSTTRKGNKMFFKTSTVFKVYETRKGAENYIAKMTGVDLHIEVIDNRFFVVG